MNIDQKPKDNTPITSITPALMPPSIDPAKITVSDCVCVENSTKTGYDVSFKLNIVSAIGKKIANPKLIEYCRNDNLKKVKKLIAKNCDVNILHDIWTPLRCAASNGHKEIVVSLLATGADPNLANKNGWTPLHSAAANNRKEIVDLLLTAGADPNLVDKDGWTPLYCAAKHGHKEIVDLLLQAKADPNLADKDGWTPLRFASLGSHKEIVVLLLAAEADPNLANKDGWTPLHFAAFNGHKDVVILLLQAKADPNLADNNGKTPIDMAEARNKTDVVKILKEHIKGTTKTVELKPENSTNVFDAEFIYENIPYKFRGTQSQFEVFRKSITGK